MDHFIDRFWLRIFCSGLQETHNITKTHASCRDKILLQFCVRETLTQNRTFVKTIAILKSKFHIYIKLIVSQFLYELFVRLHTAKSENKLAKQS